MRNAVALTTAGVAFERDGQIVRQVDIDAAHAVIDGERAGLIERDPHYAEWFETWEAQEKVYFSEHAADADFTWVWHRRPPR